jgi:hypothetical protein
MAVPNFRLYLAGQAVSLVGTWMQVVAQSWLVLQLTGSGALLGLVAAAPRELDWPDYQQAHDAALADLSKRPAALEADPRRCTVRYPGQLTHGRSQRRQGLT